MRTQKLTSTDAFIVFDLDDADSAYGVTRLAQKILPDGAVLLARSTTYAFAVFGIARSGASAGINAKPDQRDAAVAGFVEEVGPLAAEGRLVTDPGQGLSEADLEPLRSHDPRPAELRANGTLVELTIAGALAAAEAVLGGLEGRRVRVEATGPVAKTAAAAVRAAGGQVVEDEPPGGTGGRRSDARAAVDEHAGTGAPAGTGPQAGTESTLENEGAAGPEAPDSANAPAAEPQATAAAEGSDAKAGTDLDLLLVGGRPGSLDDEAAATVTAKVVVPIAPVPVTAKAFAALSHAGTVYVPDFVSLAAPLLAGFDPDGGDPVGRVRDLTAELAGEGTGLWMAAVKRAEEFLGTWQQQLPFGRPLA